jgi:hypothetical protein
MPAGSPHQDRRDSTDCETAPAVGRGSFAGTSRLPFRPTDVAKGADAILRYPAGSAARWRHHDIVGYPVLLLVFAAGLFGAAYWLRATPIAHFPGELAGGLIGAASYYAYNRLRGPRRVRLSDRNMRIRDVTKSELGTFVIPRQAIARIELLTPVFRLPVVAAAAPPPVTEDRPWFRDVSERRPEPPRPARPTLTDEQLLPPANIRIVLNDPAKVRLRHPIGLSMPWPGRSGRRKFAPRTIDIDAADVDFAYSKMLAWLNQNHGSARS